MQLTEALKVKRLSLLLFAATNARLANSMTGTALVLLVATRTHDIRLAGELVGASTLPVVFVAPMLGRLLDRTQRVRYVLGAGAAFLALTLITIFLIIGHVDRYLLIASAIPIGLVSPIGNSGYSSQTPRFAPKSLLSSANALEAMSFNVAGIAGPALVSLIAASVGGALPIIGEALLTTLTVLPLILLPNPPPLEHPKVPTTWVGLIKTIASAPDLRALTLSSLVSQFGFGMMTVLLPLFAADLTGKIALGGFLWSAFAIGALIGALPSPYIIKRLGAIPTVVLGYAGTGLVILVWRISHGLNEALIVALIAGILDGPGLTATFTIRQYSTPRWQYARVTGVASSLKTAAYAAGATVAGLMVAGLGVTNSLTLAAVIQIASAGIAWSLTKLGPNGDLAGQPAFGSAG